MKKENISEYTDEILKNTRILFDRIVKLPSCVRYDDKKRLGVMIVIQESGTRNSLALKIGKPSKYSRFFSYKNLFGCEREKEFSSQNLEKSNPLKRRGCIAVRLDDGKIILSSAAGLKEDEDVFIAASNLALVTGMSFDDVLNNTNANGGAIPEIFHDVDHYLYQISVDLKF